MGKKKQYKIEVEIKFVPFPSEEKRLEAYRTHVRLWLRAEERMLKEKYSNCRKTH